MCVIILLSGFFFPINLIRISCYELMSVRCRAEKQPRPFHRRQTTGAWETPVYFPIDARCCQAGMALGDPADSLLLLLQLLWAASPHPCSPLSTSSPPRRESGMVSSMRTCHCHSSGDGSRSVRAEGGRLHPCLPLQCGGCCCSEATPGRPFHSSSVTFSTKTPRGPPRLWRWMASLVHPWVRYERATFQRSRRSRADACPLVDRSEAITVQADVTWLPQ